MGKRGRQDLKMDPKSIARRARTAELRAGAPKIKSGRPKKAATAAEPPVNAHLPALAKEEWEL